MSHRSILILGATGQLGSELVGLYSGRLGWDLHALSHEKIDITDRTALQRVFDEVRPWAVINCAAYNNVTGAQRDTLSAFSVNSAAAALLAELSCKIGSLLVHFSTDFVFDGNLGRTYTEEDPPNPLNIYGLSKLSGERAIRLLNPRHCIIRLSGVYGKHHSPSGKTNFVDAILSQARAGGPLSVHDNLVSSPTSARTAASAVLRLLDQEALGTFHMVDSGSCSWFEFAGEILRLSGLRCELKANPWRNSDKDAPRPRNSALDTAKLSSVIGDPLPSWQEALAAYIKESK